MDIPAPPGLVYVASVSITVAAPIVVGDGSTGLRRIVPITGGHLSGPRLSGTILPGGADDQTIQPGGLTTLTARYTARLSDGVPLHIVNDGIRFGAPDVMERITRGEPVDPARVYFRTTPRFATADPAYQWLTRTLFIATGARHPDRVEITVFAVE